MFRGRWVGGVGVNPVEIGVTRENLSAGGPWVGGLAGDLMRRTPPARAELLAGPRGKLEIRGEPSVPTRGK